MSSQREPKIARRRIDTSNSPSEISSVSDDLVLADENLESYDDSDYDFEQLLDENVSLGEFDQLSDRLLTGFELQAKITSLSSSSVSSCSTPRTESPAVSTSRRSHKLQIRNGSDEADTTSNSGGETTQPKKRKRKSYYVKRFPFPRILKRDIRRDYAIMLTNVLNSADESLMLKFFHRFCMSSCQYVDCFPDEYINNKPFIRYAKGVDAIVYRLLQDFSSIPDFVIRLKNASIVQRKDIVGSKIVCQVEFSGTKMFHYMRPELITSIEEMRIMEEESKEGEDDSRISNSSHSDRKNALLQNVMKQVHELMNYTSPSTLSDTAQHLQSNRMKILSLYSDEQQQLLSKLPADVLNEMKLGSDCVDQLTTQLPVADHLAPLPLSESKISQLLSTLCGSSSSSSSISSTTTSMLSNLEEKLDTQSIGELMKQFTSSSSSAVVASSSNITDFPHIPFTELISHPQLLKKCDKPLLSKPLSIKFMGEITLSLNEEHWLSQLEVKSSIYDTKVLFAAAAASMAK